MKYVKTEALALSVLKVSIEKNTHTHTHTYTHTYKNTAGHMLHSCTQQNLHTYVGQKNAFNNKPQMHVHVHVCTWHAYLSWPRLANYVLSTTAHLCMYTSRDTCAFVHVHTCGM